MSTIYTVPGTNRVRKNYNGGGKWVSPTQIYMGVVVESVALSWYVHGYESVPHRFDSLAAAKSFVRQSQA